MPQLNHNEEQKNSPTWSYAARFDPLPVSTALITFASDNQDVHNIFTMTGQTRTTLRRDLAANHGAETWANNNCPHFWGQRLLLPKTSGRISVAFRAKTFPIRETERSSERSDTPDESYCSRRSWPGSVGHCDDLIVLSIATLLHFTSLHFIVVELNAPG